MLVFGAGGVTSEIEPAGGPAEEELAAADAAVAVRDTPDVPTCSTHRIGEMLLHLKAQRQLQHTWHSCRVTDVEA